MPYRRLAALLRCRGGSVTLLAAAGLAIAMAVCALAIDLGTLFSESRRLQGVADAAALSAAGTLSNPDAAAQAAAQASAGSHPVATRVVTGVYTADPALAAANRFVPGAGPANAARVEATEEAPLFFGRFFGRSSVRLRRSAIAARIDQAAFTLGTRVAALDAGVANQLLSGLTGSSVSLSVADYDALGEANVDLLDYVKALRTEMGLGAASFQQTLRTSTTLPHALHALAGALAQAGNGSAAGVVGRIPATAPANATTLSALADLGPLGAQDHAAGPTSLSVNGFALLQSVLQVAGGAHQITLDLAQSAPGLSSASVALLLGARPETSPWLALTGSGNVIVRTVQARLRIEAALPGSVALRALGIGIVRLPLYVELGEAQARLSAITCTPGARRVDLLVQPSFGHVAIADVDAGQMADLTSTPTEHSATFIDLAGLRATGSARTDFSSGEWQSVSFASADIEAQTVRTVTAGLSTQAIAASLAGSINPAVSLGGVSAPLSPVVDLLRPALSAAGAALDPAIQKLLAILGLHLGQADIAVAGLRCGTAALVA